MDERMEQEEKEWITPNVADVRKPGVRIDVEHVEKYVRTKLGKRKTLDDLCLSIAPGEFVAVLGEAGSGKTSLLKCIGGYQKPSSGQILLNNEDLYENREVFYNVIGSVSQEENIYGNLTVRGMLSYAARLRMSAECSRKERKEKINQTMEMMGLEGCESRVVRKLSAGQRKRVCIAEELISDPSLLLLDEPSACLDPEADRNLMQVLQTIAQTGKTVIMATNHVSQLQYCDRIIFLGKGGKLCFCGSPQEAREFFQVTDFADIYPMLREKEETWQQNYAESMAGHRNRAMVEQGALPKEGAKVSVWKQTRIMTSRYFKRMLSDGKHLLMLLVQAPLLALLIRLAAEGKVFDAFSMTKAILFTVCCGAFWMGILNAVQEVCKERKILKREFSAGISRGAYVMSKLHVLGILCFLQSGLMVVLVAMLVEIPVQGAFLPNWAELWISAFLMALFATSIGLLISVLFKKQDRAMAAAPVLMSIQILLLGSLFAIKDTIGTLAYIISWEILLILTILSAFLSCVVLRKTSA